MAKNWKDVKAELVERGLSTNETRARAEAVTEDYINAYRLSELRRERHIKQADLAAQIGVHQTRISQIEHGDLEHVEIATLRAYVGGLGGQLRVVADIDGAEVPIA